MIVVFISSISRPVDADSCLPSSLTSIPLNKAVRIDRLDGPHQDCARLLDLGFTPGEEIIVTQRVAAR